MDDSPVTPERSRAEGFNQRRIDEPRQREGELTSQERSEILALQGFHHEKGRSRMDTHVRDVYDVWVSKASGGLALPHESRVPRGSVRRRAEEP